MQFRKLFTNSAGARSFILLFACSAMTSWAEQDEGQTFTGDVAATSPPSVQEQIPENQSFDPVGEYMEAIEKAELDGGAYSPQLGDLYLGLGNSLLREKKYQEAKNAIQRGMQIDRINNGLNSLSQVPYLFSLADLDNAMGDWDSSNKAISNIYQINTNTLGASDERMLPILDRMLQWYLGNYQYQSPRYGYLYLVNSEQIANHIAMIHVETLDLEHEQAPQSFRNICAVEFALARFVDTYGVPGEDKELTYSFGQMPSRAANISAIVDRYYRRGKDALESVVQILNERGVSKQQLAEAVAQLGDWYVLFDKSSSAEKQYNLAYELLGESEDAPELQKDFFAKPRRIDFHLGTGTATGNQVDTSIPAMEVTFDISDDGVPRNLEFDDSEKKVGSSQMRKIKKEISDYRFRPPIINGTMVETKGYVYHYSLATNGQQHET